MQSMPAIPTHPNLVQSSTTQDFPFKVELSLAPLIDLWQQVVPGQHPVKGLLATHIADAVQSAPELLEPINDFSVITKHRQLIDLLMAIAFPKALWDGTYTAALVPFQFRSFYATPGFEQLLMSEDGRLSGRINVDEQTVQQVRLLHAYAFILDRIYGVKLDFDYPLILTTEDPDTGLDRHFKIQFDGRFMQVKTKGQYPALTETVKKRLFANLAAPEVWIELLPPEHFVLYGFFVLNAIDVTDQEVLSSLKRDLIEKESIVSAARFKQLQTKLRTLFRKPDLCFGLAAIQSGQVLMLNTTSHIEYG
jgi:hypothetical protein